MGLMRTAYFSPCRRYRYWLKIVWDETLPLLVVCGLNPSTADETKDDNTLRRVQQFARDMGLGGVLMLNAFAWRSTDPKGLLTCADPVGEFNHIAHLQTYMKMHGAGGKPIAAWGANIWNKKPLRYRIPHLLMLDWDCLRRTKQGHPEHPLYLPPSCRPIPWNYTP